MPYKLQKDEPLAAGFKRIADEQISGAITELQSGKIYEVRKHIKKIRAILRLLKPQLGPLHTEENRRLRDIARCFSTLRDLDVSLELLDKFSALYKRKSTLEPHRKALTQKRSAILNHGELTESVEALFATRKRIEDWPLNHLTQAFIEARLKKTHKQSSDAFALAKQTRTPEDFHELRKSVKRELNQSRLLNAEERLQALNKLGSLLGDHHNIAVLLTTLENTSVRFRRMTQRQLRNYETQILDMGRYLYEQEWKAAVRAA